MISRSDHRETTQGNDIRRSVVPGVLSDLFIRVCRCQKLPRGSNKPLPGLSSDEPFSKFDGGNYRFDIKVGGQKVGIDDGVIKWVLAP